MFILYQFLILILLIISPLIILYRIIKSKENPKRFLEKFCLSKSNRKNKNLIWFNVASVGELMSIIPLIYELEKNREIKNILVTSSTLSSSKIFQKFKFKKTFHQFFPIDFFFFSKIFIKYWKPKIAIFIDSEIWPSMFNEINKNSIPLLLLNARITKKSFSRWNIFKSFSKKVFDKISYAYPQNKETLSHLKKLHVKQIKNLGNLKFSNLSKNIKFSLKKITNKEIRNRIIFCASSTHPSEEVAIARVHMNLKKKYKNLLTIIIPRHIERTNEIYDKLNTMKLNILIKSTNKKLNNKTDIFIVDAYGETKYFYNLSKLVFMGGSLINHGGQNPIEPARFNKKVIHGPYVDNFKDIYEFFAKQKVTYKVKNITQLVQKAEKILKNKSSFKLNLDEMGRNILRKTSNEINKKFYNEIQKTKILGL